MQLRLGYLGTPLTLNEKFHTMTYKKYKSLKEKASEELDKIILTNLKNFNKVIDYNIENHVNFYRMTHNILPLASIKDIDYDYQKFHDIWKKIGLKIKKHNLRIDAHPDHYLVLNSLNNEVLKNSIRILLNHALIFKMLDINGKVILHLGTNKPSKKEAMLRFQENFLKLPDDIKKIIILENDDKTYTVSDTLELCEKLNVPMVLDYHHFNCNHLKTENIKELLPRIIKTWDKEELNPKMHFSSPKSQKEKRTHNFYIDYRSFLKFINLLKPLNKDIDIMLESKGKDEALFKLLRQLKHYKPYKIKYNTIYF